MVCYHERRVLYITLRTLKHETRLRVSFVSENLVITYGLIIKTIRRTKKMSQEQNTNLKRGLKSRHLSMIAMGGAIGTGIS